MAKLLITLALALALCPPPVLAITLPDLSADESFNNYSRADGKKFLEHLRKNVDSFNDYCFDSAIFMYKPGAEQVAGGNLCWKRVNLVKLIVKSKGYKDGAIVVRSPDGKIKACGGPNLRFLKMTLSEDSRVLQIPNGYNAMKSDLGNLLSKASDSISNGNTARVTAEPINVPRLKQNVYVLQIFKPSAGGDVLCDQIYINQTNNIPIEWDIFKGGVRYSVATFENFKSNIGLDDSQFQI